MGPTAIIMAIITAMRSVTLTEVGQCRRGRRRQWAAAAASGQR